MAYDLGPLILMGAAAFAILKAKGVNFTAPLNQAPTFPSQPIAPTTPNTGGNAYNTSTQAALNRLLGLNLATDGVLGPATRAAISQFQTRIGANPTGILDSETDKWLRYYDANYNVWVSDSNAGDVWY